MKILLCLLATLVLASAALAAMPKNEKEFREQVGLQDYKDVSYRDRSGATVDYDKFYASAQGGKGVSVNIAKNSEKGWAVVSILDKTPAAAPFLIKRGESLPVQSLINLDGATIPVESRNGRPLLINFFFAACAPCITETPALNAFAQQRKDIDVVAITFDEPATVRKFIAKHRFAWPIVPAAQDLLEELGVKAFPAFAYLGKDGRVLGIAEASAITEDELTSASLQAWIGKLEAK